MNFLETEREIIEIQCACIYKHQDGQEKEKWRAPIIKWGYCIDKKKLRMLLLAMIKGKLGQMILKKTIIH